MAGIGAAVFLGDRSFRRDAPSGQPDTVGCCLPRLTDSEENRIEVSSSSWGQVGVATHFYVDHRQLAGHSFYNEEEVILPSYLRRYLYFS